MKIFKKLFLTLAFALLLAAPITVVAVPTTTYAAGPLNCDRTILGIPNWYRGLTDDKCNVKSPETGAGKTSIALNDFIWRIVLNIIEIGLFIAGYIALFFIIYGGFQYLTGGSNPGQVEKARKTILDAIIGLAISMASIAIVNLVFNLIRT